MAMAFFGSIPALAQTANSVYIDQIGSNSTIDVTQQGSNNIVGTNTSRTILWGSNQSVTISQVGSSNIAALNVQGANSVVNTIVEGSLNTVTIGCGTGGSGNNASCTDSSITANATGDSNTLSITTGSKSTASITATGDNNTATINTNTSPLVGNTATISAVGDGNTLSISQTGTAGVNGHSGTIDVTGSSNLVAVTQTGTIDTTVNVKSVGSNNNITVTTGN